MEGMLETESNVLERLQKEAEMKTAKEVTSEQVEKAKRLIADWCKSPFKGSYDDFHLMSNDDVLQNFAEWIVWVLDRKETE